jgi:adhesin transport system outer membrane protein
MNAIKKKQVLTFIGCMCFAAFSQAQTVSLQTLLGKLSAYNELLKSGRSQVQARQAEVRSVAYDRLPNLNTMYQATAGSDNNVQGPYLGMGLVPSVTGGSRAYSNVNAVAGNTALAGVDWEAVNFGRYKAQTDVAKAGLLTQNSAFAKTQYDLDGIAAAYYIELLRQHELQLIDQDNVARLQQLLISINGLVVNGIRPGVDSSIASAELSKSMVALYDAQRGLAQTQAQLSALTGMPAPAILADTVSEYKIISTGATYAFSAVIDTAHHPDIMLYSSLYGLSRAQLELDRKRFYPRIFLDADAWTRGSSLSSTDQFNDLGQGYIPQRVNYFVGLTFTYDIMNIMRKKLSTSVSKYESEASAHDLEQARIDINNSYQQSLIESEYQRKRLRETARQLESASTAYDQQANLYRNGLSSIIELDVALSYYIQARKDYLDSKVGYMRSILSYSLVTNSFNSLVQTLKL